ncbi:MAG: hypothetical protein H0X17_06885, partial [Deltaproteobacteria bacterium]|nr:hypothetical protein [Deltaproteobacteria bacterium]
LYLRARNELRRFWGEHAVTAATLLEQAVAYAPTYPPLLCALALAATQAWAKTTDPALLPRARATVERALATGHGEALLASAILRMNFADPEGGAADLGAALIRAPMSAPAHEIAGRMLLELGAGDEARQRFATAIGLDADRTQLISLDVARLDALSGDWASAERAATLLGQHSDPSIAMLGAFAHSRFACWRGDLALALASIQRLPPALARLNTTDVLAIATQYLRDGTFDDARWAHAMATAEAPDRPRRMQLLVLQRAVEIGVLVRRPDAAVDALQRAIPRGLVDIVWFDACPLFVELRADPRTAPLRADLAARAGRALDAFRAAR